MNVPSIHETRRQMYRMQIISAAEYEFARAGFEKTKVANIARTADVSLATLYKHFAGKDEIWDVLNQQRVEEFISAGQQAIADCTSPVQRLFASLHALVTYFAEHPNYLRIHVSEGLSWATGGHNWGRGNQRDAWRTGIDTMVALAHDAVESEGVPPMRPSLLAGLVVSALQVWLTDWVNSEFDRPADDVTLELTQYLRRSLELPAAAVPGRRARKTPPTTESRLPSK